MDDIPAALLGAVASALFSAYFIGSFAFVAYALRKYDALKDELRHLHRRLDALSSANTILKQYGDRWATDAGGDGPGASP